MWRRLGAEIGARWNAHRGSPRVRRARAVLRLHRKTLLAAALGAGIVLMVLHWK